MNPKYRQIADWPPHRSERRPPMPLMDRAAQFAPFSALSGHAEGAAETARVTQSKIELSEDAIAQLDLRLLQLEESTHNHPHITITYFCPDQRKSGGAYCTVAGNLKKIDGYRRCLVLEGDSEIPIGDIRGLEGELWGEDLLF